MPSHVKITKEATNPQKTIRRVGESLALAREEETKGGKKRMVTDSRKATTPPNFVGTARKTA